MPRIRRYAYETPEGGGAIIDGEGIGPRIGLSAPIISRRTVLGALAASCSSNARSYPASSARTVYLSASGDDSAGGTSALAPWRTLQRLLREPIAPGDRILFRRGDTFRGSLELLRNPAGADDRPAVVGAYGTGSRPVIVGYERLPAGAWLSAGGSLWKTRIEVDTLRGEAHSNRPDVGNIGFLRVDGRIHGDKVFSVSALVKDWQFYSDESGWLYVRLMDNPGQVSREIMAAPRHHGSEQSNIVIRDLDFCGFGGHGIHGSLRNVTIENCIIREIGGSCLRETTRFGNGVECWSGSHNVLVRGNLIQDVYDVACTMQGDFSSDPSAAWTNIVFEQNTIKRCNQALEIWARSLAGSGLSDITPFRETAFLDNDVSAIGYAWSSDVRPDRMTRSPILFNEIDASFVDLVIRGNRFRDFAGALIFSPKGASPVPDGVKFEQNDVSFARPDQLIQAHMPYGPKDWASFARASGATAQSRIRVSR